MMYVCVEEDIKILFLVVLVLLGVFARTIMRSKVDVPEVK